MERDGFRHSFGGFFEGQGDIRSNIATTSLATASAAASSEQAVKNASAENVAEGFKNILDVAVLSGAAVNARVAKLVIAGPFVGVTQYLVCLSGLFEFCDAVRVILSAIGMILDGKFAICGRNLALCTPLDNSTDTLARR